MIVARKKVKAATYYGSFDRGIQCLKCGCVDTKVKKTYPIIDRIKRVRICRACGARRVTYED